jgi:signal transduction histidine kinase
MGGTESPVRLERSTFLTNRLLDFASEKELTAQTGHPPAEWPLVIVKELVDNALDACEEAGIAPEIGVRVGTHGITVMDNGPGLPAKVVAGVSTSRFGYRAAKPMSRPAAGRRATR